VLVIIRPEAAPPEEPEPEPETGLGLVGGLLWWLIVVVIVMTVRHFIRQAKVTPAV
jgi:hypothetical protein